MSFPEFIDSTMLATYKKCPAQFMHYFILRLKPQERNWHLHAGIAMAEALATARRAWVNGNSSWKEEGFKSLIRSYGPEDSPIPAKSFERLAVAYAKYWDRWPIGTGITIWGQGVEFTFAIPLPVNNPDTGMPLFYSGRCDWIGEYNGSIYVVDEKTTASLGETWANRWPNRGQLLGYVWAAREMGIPAIGCAIRGIALTTEPSFAEEIFPIPDWKLNHWFADTLEWINRIIEDYKGNKFPKLYYDECGTCPFRPCCHTREPEKWREALFDVEEWDPLR